MEHIEDIGRGHIDDIPIKRRPLTTRTIEIELDQSVEDVMDFIQPLSNENGG